MGLTWFVLAVFAALLCVGLVSDLKRRRGVLRTLPRGVWERARKDALHAERLRVAHLHDTSGVPPSVAGDGISGGG